MHSASNVIWPKESEAHHVVQSQVPPCICNTEQFSLEASTLHAQCLGSLLLFSMMFTKIYPRHLLLITISEKKNEAKWTQTLRVTLILAYVYFCGGKSDHRTFRPSMWSHCSNVHMHKEKIFCTSFVEVRASLVAQMVKNPPAMQETWVGKIPWRRQRLPTPVFWPVQGVAKSRTQLSHLHFHLELRTSIWSPSIGP